MAELFNKITNIEFKNSTTISLAKALFIFYVFVASNYTSTLMSKQMQFHVENNRFTQHFIGFLVMVVLISSFGNTSDAKLILLYSFIVYIWFILTTKLDLQLNILILCLLLGAYMYENNLDNGINKDTVLTAEQLILIQNDNKFYKRIIVGSIFLFTLVGTVVYSEKKISQYGGGYSTFKYFIG